METVFVVILDTFELDLLFCGLQGTKSCSDYAWRARMVCLKFCTHMQTWALLMSYGMNVENCVLSGVVLQQDYGGTIEPTQHFCPGYRFSNNIFNTSMFMYWDLSRNLGILIPEFQLMKQSLSKLTPVHVENHFSILCWTYEELFYNGGYYSTTLFMCSLWIPD